MVQITRHWEEGRRGACQQGLGGDLGTRAERGFLGASRLTDRVDMRTTSIIGGILLALASCGRETSETGTRSGTSDPVAVWAKPTPAPQSVLEGLRHREGLVKPGMTVGEAIETLGLSGHVYGFRGSGLRRNHNLVVEITPPGHPRSVGVLMTVDLTPTSTNLAAPGNVVSSYLRASVKACRVTDTPGDAVIHDK